MYRIETVVYRTDHIALSGPWPKQAVPKGPQPYFAKYGHVMLVVSLKWVMTLPVSITTIDCSPEYSTYSTSKGSQWLKAEIPSKGLPMVFKENSATWQEPCNSPKGFLHVTCVT